MEDSQITTNRGYRKPLSQIVCPMCSASSINAKKIIACGLESEVLDKANISDYEVYVKKKVELPLVLECATCGLELHKVVAASVFYKKYRKIE